MSVDDKPMTGEGGGLLTDNRMSGPLVTRVMLSRIVVEDFWWSQFGWSEEHWKQKMSKYADVSYSIQKTN